MFIIYYKLEYLLFVRRMIFDVEIFVFLIVGMFSSKKSMLIKM